MSRGQASADTLAQLIAFPSVSSTSNQQISDWLAARLQRLGFEVRQSKYRDDKNTPKVNLVSRRDPVRSGAARHGSGLAYFCHTDVVPPGAWTGPGGDPFAAVVHDDRIYGRGACDMKGSLAAMITAVESIDPADQSAPLWIVCTADEEVNLSGAKKLMQDAETYSPLAAQQPLSIIGEPTGMNVVYAHKGIYGFEIISRGRAAHSSTTDGINANVAMVPMLQTLLELGQRSEQDDRYRDPRFDPPTLSWNFGVREGGSAINITPERSIAWVSLRPMPGIDGRDLVAAARATASQLGLEFAVHEGCDPLWVDPESQPVVELCQLSGSEPRTVCYGTDGGVFNDLQQRVVWGPGDIAQAHTSDEWIALDQLDRGTELYAAAIRKWCC